jgi:hypothetical protein
MFNKLNQVASKISSFYSSVKTTSRKPRRRYLASVYSSLAVVRSAYERFEKEQLKKTSYDPFQVEQLSEIYQYNPFHQESSSNSTSDMSDDNTVVDDMIVVDERQETTVMVHSTLMKHNDDDEQVHEPVTKRIRTMATSAAENAVHTFIYGAMVTFDFVWAEKKSLKDFVQEKSKQITTPQPKKMRGFGVDFSPVVERSPALQIRMDRAERNIRDICKRAELSVQENVTRQRLAKGYGRLPLKRSHGDDDTWGMVESDYSVRFKF